MRKLMFGILVAFSVVSVSFGAWIPEKYEENYQKLKTELEEYGGGEGCKWSEDGKKLISGNLCQYKKILMFFDEIRATEADGFFEALQKVREMPLFKNDGGIYSYTRGINLDQFWEHWLGEYGEWDKTKRKLRMDGFRSDYWKKLAE